MPWYWSDDLATVLATSGKLDPQVAENLGTAPVAYRLESDSLEEAASELAEDGEIPLAA